LTFSPIQLNPEWWQAGDRKLMRPPRQFREVIELAIMGHPFRRVTLRV